MSIIYSIACLDCAVYAPEIGSFGYIGYPTLDNSDESDPPNFGYLYEAFAGIQLITWDLHLVHEFLQQHAGHRVLPLADNEPFIDDPKFRDVDSDLARLPNTDDIEGIDPTSLRDAAWTDAAATAYPQARFRLHCAPCYAEHLSEASDNIRRFAPVTLTAESIKQFRERMEGQLDSSTFMNAAPLDGGDVDYPNLEALLEFLEEHADHPITASMVLAD